MKRCILTLLFLIAYSSFTLIAPSVASAAPATHARITHTYDTHAGFVLTHISTFHKITKPAVADYSCNITCNNTNPQGTSCAQGAQTVISAYITDPQNNSNNWGLVEMRWSPTCGTNWTRVTSYIGSLQLYATVEHPAGADGGEEYYTSGIQITTQTWSKMVYSPDDPVISVGNITLSTQRSARICNTGLC